MRLFYHHVGLVGATEDFPKTVFNKVSIRVVEDNLNPSSPLRNTILTRLRASFPSGQFNCWGVPSGAKFVIQNLTLEDTVLLVESAAFNGRVPALCQVRGFWKEELHDLSHALWGNIKFPYIFFFDTEHLALTWGQLSQDLQFSPNFNPRGQFYSVSTDKLEPLGGAAVYATNLRLRYSTSSSLTYRLTTDTLNKTVYEQKAEYVADIEDEYEQIRKLSTSAIPQLTEDRGKITSITSTTPRSAAFRAGIAQLYHYKCAVCGLGVQSPNGKAEVESAHIYPRSLDGSDDLRNGLCLCRLHHWAFDAGWFSLTDGCTIVVRDDIPQSDDYSFIRSFHGVAIVLPKQHELRPHPVFLQEHRKLHGFE